MPGMTVGFGPAANQSNGTLGAQGVYTPTSWVSGNAFATARAVLSGTWVGSVKWQLTLDGFNWINAPGAQQVSTISANPPILFASAASGLVAVGDSVATSNGTYEIPIPGNCVGVRALMGAYTSGAATAQIGPSKLYVPGAPVTAVLYDVSAGSGVANSTGVLDTSGWASLSWVTQLSANTTMTISEVNDSGGLYNLLVSASTGNQFGGLGAGQGIASTVVAVTTSAVVALPRRTQLDSAALVGATNRIRVESRR